jgi:uncharacterized protein HemX
MDTITPPEPAPQPGPQPTPQPQAPLTPPVTPPAGPPTTPPPMPQSPQKPSDATPHAYSAETLSHQRGLLLGIAVVIILVLIAIAAAWLYWGTSSSPASVQRQGSIPLTTSQPTNTPAPVATADVNLQSVDSSLTAADTDLTGVDQGLSDKAPDLSQ